MLPTPSFCQLTNFLHLEFLLRNSLSSKALVASLTSPVNRLLSGAPSRGLWKAVGSLSQGSLVHDVNNGNSSTCGGKGFIVSPDTALVC